MADRPTISITNDYGSSIEVRAVATVPLRAIQSRNEVTMADVEAIEIVVSKAPGSAHEVEDD